MSNQRIFLHPGYVFSRTDGERHYITAAKLGALYGLNYRACLIIDDARPETFKGLSPHDGDIHLYPRADGNYEPNEELRRCMCSFKTGNTFR